MSRIWKSPITIPAWVTIENQAWVVKVKWPKWELSQEVRDFVKIEQNENQLTVTVANEEDSFQKWVWWLTRTLVSNMVTWVTAGYEKNLEVQWVGYKFDVASPTKLVMSLGFSHKVEVNAPAWITVAIDPNNKNIISIKWIDKQLVGFFAAKVRWYKKPEPYKGKWIRYVGEYVRRKAWKTAGKK